MLISGRIKGVFLDTIFSTYYLTYQVIMIDSSPGSSSEGENSRGYSDNSPAHSNSGLSEQAQEAHSLPIEPNSHLPVLTDSDSETEKETNVTAIPESQNLNDTDNDDVGNNHQSKEGTSGESSLDASPREHISLPARLNNDPIVPDLSSNDEDDGDGDGSIGEIQGNKVKKEFTVDDIVGPRLYSDPEDEEKEEEEIQPTLIELEMPRCRANLGTNGPLFLRIPNFLSIETKPFDPETYEDEGESGEKTLDEEGKSRLKLKVENTIRWRTRQSDEGTEIKESNAKIVRWSDGTMSLYLGNEIFDVDREKIMDFNHLFIKQGQALQAQAAFVEKLKFRPHSTDTLTHRKVTLNMASKTGKSQKVKVITDVGDNPETQKQELIRQEEERLKAQNRREAQQRRLRERPRLTGLTSGFLEGADYDSDGGESIAGIKRRFQQTTTGIQQADHDSSEEELRDVERIKNIVDAKISSDEESDGEKSQQKQSKKKIVIDDDDA